MKLTSADWVRIAGSRRRHRWCAEPAGASKRWGVLTGTAAHIISIAGFVVLAVSIVSSKLALPSPPPGTNYGAIPQGTIPVVGTSNGEGPSVAHVNPDTTTVVPLAKGTNP